MIRGRGGGGLEMVNFVSLLPLTVIQGGGGSHGWIKLGILDPGCRSPHENGGRPPAIVVGNSSFWWNSDLFRALNFVNQRFGSKVMHI